MRICLQIRVHLPSILLLTFLQMVSGCSRSSIATPVGDWDASVITPSGEKVFFALRLENTAQGARAILRNGAEENGSTEATIDATQVKARFDYYDGNLTAELHGARLEGSFTRQWRHESLQRVLVAERHNGSAKPLPALAREFDGNWLIGSGEGANKQLSELAISVNDQEIRATVLNLSGDWGTFQGQIQGNDLLLTRFDGINARAIRLHRSGDRIEGTIDMGTRAKPTTFSGERATEANRKLLPDPSTAARMRNYNEPFKFSFNDADGTLISSADARFDDKVVIVTITGTWCPNCHDEAPFLEELYARYRSQGLEVVGLAFEYTGDARRDTQQIRSFSRRHGLTFPVLLAGTTDEGDLQRKLPQIENFSGYPTTLYIGRDGLVRHIHTGFEGKATGDRFLKLKTDIEQIVKNLIAE